MAFKTFWRNSKSGTWKVGKKKITALRLSTTDTESTEEHATGNAAWPWTFQLSNLQKSDISAAALQIGVHKPEPSFIPGPTCFMLWVLILFLKNMFWKFHLRQHTSQRKGRKLTSALLLIGSKMFSGQFRIPQVWCSITGSWYLRRMRLCFSVKKGKFRSLLITLVDLIPSAVSSLADCVTCVRSCVCVCTAAYTVKVWDFSYRGRRTWPGHAFSFSGPRGNPPSQDGWPQRACPPRTAPVEEGLVDCKKQQRIILIYDRETRMTHVNTTREGVFPNKCSFCLNLAINGAELPFRKSPKARKRWESTPIGDLEPHRSLVHELDDLVFISELRQRVLLLAFHKVLQAREAGDLEAISHRLVHGGVHCCQHAGTLEKYQTTEP